MTEGGPEPAPARSAVELAAQLGDTLADADALAPEALALVRRARELVEAVLVTDVPPTERAAVAKELGALVDRLLAARREPVILLARHADGRLANLTQAGTGRLNPHALDVRFDPFPPPPAPGSEPVPVEIVARCTLTATHGGPPDRAHGGVVATLFDEALGVAAHAAGATGLTAGLDVRYRRATPLHVPLVVSARWTRRDGRTSFATGELRAGEDVTAEATAVFVNPR